MALIISENFQGVTAPAMPADVTGVPQGTTAIATSTTFAYPSQTNSVVATLATGNGPTACIYSNATDNSNGNCVVSASVYTPTTAAGFYCGVVLSVGGQWVNAAANQNSYRLYTAAANGIFLDKMVLGVQSASIAAITPGGLITFGAWYTLKLYRNGSTLTGTVQRQSDGNWLTAAGAWQATYATAVSVVDTVGAGPLASAASYGGIFLDSFVAGGGPASVYGTNLNVSDYKTTLPVGPIKGLNVCPSIAANTSLTTAGEASSGGWLNFSQGMWGQFVLTGIGGIKTQIQLAKSLGCNCIRMIGCQFGVWQGLYSQPTYLANLNSIISYCQSLNLYFYLSEMSYAGPQSASYAILSSAMATALGQVATSVAAGGHKNILGFDISQEFQGASPNTVYMYNGATASSGNIVLTAGQLLDLVYQELTAVRAAISGTSLASLPLTMSFNGLMSEPNGLGTGANIWTTVNTDLSTYSYLFDYIDYHCYYAPGSSADSTPLYNSSNSGAGVKGTQGKYLFVGEFGDDMALTLQGGASRVSIYNAVYNNIVNVSYPGGSILAPGCIGLEAWAIVPQNTQGGTFDYGVFDQADALRADVGSTFTGFPAASNNLVQGFRRRRR